MDTQPNSEKIEENTLICPNRKRPRGAALSAMEKVMINNTFKYIYSESIQSFQSGPDFKYEIKHRLKSKCVAKVAEILGIAARTVYSVLKQVNENYPDPPKHPKKPGRKLSFKDKYDESTFSAIRSIVHQFFYRNECPTILKVTHAVNEDKDLPNFSKETMRKVLKHLNIHFNRIGVIFEI